MNDVYVRYFPGYIRDDLCVRLRDTVDMAPSTACDDTDKSVFAKSIMDLAKEYLENISRHKLVLPEVSGVGGFHTEAFLENTERCSCPDVNKVCECICMLNDDPTRTSICISDGTRDDIKPIPLKQGTVVILPSSWNYTYRFLIDDHDNDKNSVVEKCVVRCFLVQNPARPVDRRGWMMRKQSSFATVHDSLIKIDENRLDAITCDSLIRHYESRSSERVQGITVSGEDDSKKTFDLIVNDDNLNNTLYEKLGHELTDYVNLRGNSVLRRLCADGCRCLHLQLQKYERGHGFYRNHIDDDQYGRILTFIWYLNDVEKGGHTVFHPSTSEEFHITPRKGTLVMFPSTWTFTHCATMPVSSDKYICTGWIYADDLKRHLIMRTVIADVN